ncbi:hypothetical protein ACB098_06G224600 [Castanea mollissima]
MALPTLLPLVALAFELTSSSSSSFSSSSALLCSQVQSSALLQFKQLFSFSESASFLCHNSYPKMESWKVGTDCCSWDGVTCDRVRRDVIGLDLSCSWLYGTIPSNIRLFLLPHLQHLNLAFNDFSLSPISSGFVDMSLVSVSSFMNLSSSLTSLTLEACQLNGRMSNNIFHLPNLRELNLKENRELMGVFPMANWTNPLRFLDVSSTTLFLRVANNKLYGSIPKSISNLANLRDLDISSNNLSGIVDFDKLTKLKYLQDLDLSYNSISLSIKKWMFEIGENLRYLNLSHNFLSRKFPIPPFSTEILFISNNSLIGNIPSMICNISSLRLFDLSHNSLSGTLPQCLGNISESIQVMDLRMNNFHGAIPNKFAKDNQLITLVINGNQLEGLLPKALVNCKKMEVLDLGNNKQIILKVLVLKSNRFYGPIENHKTSGNIFSKLRILDLSHNEFTGLLPRNYFQNLNAMMTKDEGKKQQYIGETDYYQDSVVMTVKEIPKVLARLTILRLLNLSHNSLTGHILLSLANLSALESLDLSSNRLIGDIHIQLTSLTFLAKLNLSQNQLTGPIPQGKQFGTFENDSYYGNLGLCGFTLSIKCSNDGLTPPTLPTIFQEDND